MDSRYFSTGDLVTLLAALVVGFVVFVLVAAALLRLSMQWLEQSRPGFLRCLGAVLVGGALGTAASSVVMTVLGMAALAFGVAGYRGAGMDWGAMAASGVSGLVFSAVGLALAVQWLVPRSDGAKLGFKRALVVAASAVGMWTVVYAACIGGLLLAVGGIPGVSR